MGQRAAFAGQRREILLCCCHLQPTGLPLLPWLQQRLLGMEAEDPHLHLQRQIGNRRKSWRMRVRSSLCCQMHVQTAGRAMVAMPFAHRSLPEGSAGCEGDNGM